MNTIRSFIEHNNLQVKEAAIRRRLERNNFGKYTIHQPLPPDIITTLQNWYLKGGQTPAKRPIDQAKNDVDQAKPLKPELSQPADQPGKQPGKTPIIEKQLNINYFDQRGNNWALIREAVPASALPMLGLAASYGVYFFAVQFVPVFIAVIEAASFELIYIGLAMIKVDKEQKQYARYVSQGAVAVSVLYNSIAAAIHLQPSLIENLDLVMTWILAVIHGAPLAVLAYLVSDLLFHRD